MLSNERSVSDASTVTRWYKSSYSGGGQSDCLEVACGRTTVPVRDSKNGSKLTLLFSLRGWTFFVGAVKGGHFKS
ncbi:DUF397 domain-containing protein [Streptomyces misionensis]|uniref:DUF397 domain-containing protein n=1 Tax=Streptomyces misionensis TaxID=67331 RepID=A0A5C6JQ14_9ACTN|nr:DUF397 domain-containing protein [Streptomyces misionensis]TWV42707.1 DUF397 domain-containing protein [Streptomyces misionensis]